MATPVWQILAKLDRIHELQAQASAREPVALFTIDPESESASGARRKDIGEVHASTQGGRRSLTVNAQVLEATAKAAASMHAQRVPVNVYEAPEALVIVAPLPAVTADDVTITLQHGFVRFHAALRSAAPRPYLVHEWEYGGFEGFVELPRGFGSTIEASLANGQLVIRVLRGDLGEQITVHPSSPRKSASTSRRWDDAEDSTMTYPSII